MSSFGAWFPFVLVGTALGIVLVSRYLPERYRQRISPRVDQWLNSGLMIVIGVLALDTDRPNFFQICVSSVGISLGMLFAVLAFFKRPKYSIFFNSLNKRRSEK